MAAYDNENAYDNESARRDGPVVVGPGQQAGVEPLEDFFARTPRVAVAFSGGCDSSYLLAAALRAGCQVKAYGVRTAFQPAFEVEDALRLAGQLGADFELIDADVLSHADICENAPDRCYRCKTFIFSTILERMARDGYEVLVDGTNTTDDPANRPGFRALAELGVISPLRRGGLSKDDVRAASRELGLFTADKPSFSCLAVHVPKGEALTAGSLSRAAETSGAARIMADRRSGASMERILETERLTLRKMGEGDLDALRIILQDPDVMYAYEGPFDETGVREWLDRQTARYRTDGFGLWAVVLKETDRMIGQCGITLQEYRDAQVMEVGYLFMKAFWHRGYATEAAIACRDYAFDALGAREVYSLIRDTNEPSQAVARRNGMTPHATVVKHYRGVRMPHVAFSITREERDALADRRASQ